MSERISLTAALTAVPHVSAEAWRAASLPVRWLISARAGVLVMTFASASLGGLLGLSDPAWDPLAWGVCTLGLLLAHAANNQLNDLTDSARGIDEGNYFRVRYGAHVLEHGLLSRRGLIAYLAWTLGLAALAGAWLVWHTGPGLLLPMVLGGFFLLFYTWPLKQWGLGELAVLLVWGPLMVGGTDYAATGTWHWSVAVVGLLYAIGPTLVIFGKHIDKLDFDRAKGVATLPVRLGAVRARRWVRAMLVLQYLGVPIVVLLGWLPWPALLVLLALPKARRTWQVYGAPAPDTPPAGYPQSAWPLWYVAFAFDHTRLWSLLLLVGLCLAPGVTRAATWSPPWSPPNVVVILVDDAGFMDFGGYGGEARTPHIDALAADGVRFTQYRTSPLCAPSRAMLLTGLDNHLTGVATIPEVLEEVQAGQRGYAMHLQAGVETVAARLKRAGYRTYMAGKWHLGSRPEDLPDAHGFDRSLALDASGADNWEQKSYIPYYDSAPWFEDGEPVTLPASFYSSELLVDRLIGYLRDDAAGSPPEDAAGSPPEDAAGARPFFAYLAFQAVHIPVQAPRAFSDHYDGVFATGWEEVRRQRWERARDLGLVPDTAPLADMHPALRRWGDLDADEQRLMARSMAVNAGMLEAMDHHVGRLVDHLKEVGQFENTLFIVTSDNGPEFNDPLSNPAMRLWMWGHGYHHDLERLGEPGSMGFIGPEWASAAASPFALFKFYAAEGGLRVPLIVSGPGVAALGFVDAMSFVTDITPTILDLAEAAPEERDGLTGRSLRPVLDSSAVSVYGEEEAIGMEVSGNSALFRGGYKLVRNTLPHGDGAWRLYFVREDPGETRDLSEVLPETFAALTASYEAYARSVGVVPLPADFDPVQAITRNTLNRQPVGISTVLLAGIAALAAVAATFFYRRQRRRRSS
ncbi:MAG: sulfatase-like hydrolase/transferase [Pseudomonadales bacterium]